MPKLKQDLQLWNSDINLSVFERPLPEIETPFALKVIQRTIALLTTAYNINFSDTKSVNYEKIKMIYNLAYEDKFSANEFGLMIKQFIKKNPFVNFTPANVFQFSRPKLYSESWKNKEYQKDVNSIALMEALDVSIDGKTVSMYRYYDPLNPKIDNPNIQIAKGWDVGKIYAEPKENINLEFLLKQKENEIEKLKRIIKEFENRT